MEPNFPVFIREKDSGDIFYASSISELQYHLERVDVEDNEYEAWDASGTPLQLLAHEPIWLDVKMLSGSDKQMTLEDAISDFATKKQCREPSHR